MSIINSRGIQPLALSTTQRTALTAAQKPVGLIVYDTDQDEALLWNGSIWIILGDGPGSLIYIGSIDATTTAPQADLDNGYFYINTVSGTCAAGWVGISGQPLGENDRLVYNGTEWDIFPIGSIPSLQAVTTAGNTTTEGITAGSFTTAGDLSASAGTFAANLTAEGDVGIGTSSPQEKLHVNEGNIVIGQTSDGTTLIRNYVKFGREANPKAAIGFVNNASNGRGDLLFMNSNAADGNEFTGSEEVMRIDSDGKVGIGVNDPDESLDVLGNIQLGGTSSYLKFVDTDAAGGSYNQIDSYEGTLSFSVDPDTTSTASQ